MSPAKGTPKNLIFLPDVDGGLFRIGDQVRVTDRKGDWNHGLAVGTEEVWWVVEKRTYNGRMQYVLGNEAKPRCPQWMFEVNLASALPPPVGQEEIDALFGLAPRPAGVDTETLRRVREALSKWAVPPAQVITWLSSWIETEEARKEKADA